MTRCLTFCSILFALSLGSLFATSECCESQWDLSVDFLYLLPTVDDTYFVMDSPITTTFPNGKRKNNDFKFHPGFRVGGAYLIDECGRELQVYYTRLRAKRSTTVSGDFLWATVGRPDLVSLFEDFAGSASSHLNLLYERVDGFLAQHTMQCSDLDLSLRLGLEYAYLRLSEAFTYRDELIDSTVHQTSKAWGIGPQLGFSVAYDMNPFENWLTGRLGLVAHASGSLLSSQTKASEKNQTVGVTLLDLSDRSTWRVVTALHARVGLKYDACFEWLDASFEVGYEFNTYLRGLARVAFPDDVADGLCYTNYYNFDVQGLYLSATAKF